jgi:hypothetical protein
MRVVRWLRLEGRERSQHSQQSSCHHSELLGYESKDLDKRPFTGAVIVAGRCGESAMSICVFKIRQLVAISVFFAHLPDIGAAFSRLSSTQTKSSRPVFGKKQTICVRI